MIGNCFFKSSSEDLIEFDTSLSILSVINWRHIVQNISNGFSIFSNHCDKCLELWLVLFKDFCNFIVFSTLSYDISQAFNFQKFFCKFPICHYELLNETKSNLAIPASFLESGVLSRIIHH
jgi:hypothetical protein